MTPKTNKQLSKKALSLSTQVFVFLTKSDVDLTLEQLGELAQLVQAGLDQQKAK